jgi:hypothetical protein
LGAEIGASVAGERTAHVVEVDDAGLTWIKSSMSDSSAGGCLEAANAGDRVIVRCARDRAGSRLSQPWPAWAALISWLA